MLLVGQAEQWETPNTCERGPESRESKDKRGSGGIDLQTQALGWPTPTSGDAKGIASSEDAKALGFDATLSEAGKAWPSPRAEDSESCGNHPGKTDSLTGATRSWPTPMAQDCEYAGSDKANMETLPNSSRGWASPAARDEKGANGPEHQQKDRPHEDQLANQAVHAFACPSFPPDATTTDDGLPSLLKVWTRPSSPRLSPAFQWWLMRWPHPRAIYCASGGTEWIRWWSAMRSCAASLRSEVRCGE